MGHFRTEARTLVLQARDSKGKIMSETPAPTTVNMTMEQLMALIKEMKAPAPPTEAELNKIKQEQETRKRTALRQQDIVAAKKRAQKICTHMRRDGTSRCVL